MPGIVRTQYPRWLVEAAGYWEPRRLPYNLVLGVVALAWLVVTWPHFRPALGWHLLALLLILAMLANACYCAAYVVELVLRESAALAAWRRRRAYLWLAGTLLAVLVECYWIADEIYPAVG